jgi:hypothetical protein
LWHLFLLVNFLGGSIYMVPTYFLSSKRLILDRIMSQRTQTRTSRLFHNNTLVAKYPIRGPPPKNIIPHLNSQAIQSLTHCVEPPTLLAMYSAFAAPRGSGARLSPYPVPPSCACPPMTGPSSTLRCAQQHPMRHENKMLNLTEVHSYDSTSGRSEHMS